MRLEFMSEEELVPYLNQYGFELVNYPSPERVVTKCIKYGHEKEYSIYYIKRAQCNECLKQQRRDDVRNLIESQGYQLLNEYTGDQGKLKMICSNGHSRECNIGSFRNYNCKECVNEEKLEILIDNVLDRGYTFIKYPKNARDVVITYCPKGHIREAKIHNFLNFDCGECIGKSFPKNIELCHEVFNSRGFTLLETEYLNCKTRMKYICTCGEIRYNTMDVILNSEVNSCYSCKSKKYSGEKHPNWNGGITPEHHKDRHRKPYKIWRKSALERDNYTCQCCRDKENQLQVHHIESYSHNIESRYDIHNAITMCINCHDMFTEGSFHFTYGSYDNNLFQLQEYFDDIRTHLGLPSYDIYKEIVYNQTNTEIKELQLN